MACSALICILRPSYFYVSIILYISIWYRKCWGQNSIDCFTDPAQIKKNLRGGHRLASIVTRQAQNLVKSKEEEEEEEKVKIINCYQAGAEWGARNRQPSFDGHFRRLLLLFCSLSSQTFFALRLV